MIGILCEKPSAAKNFAKALGGMNGRYNGEQYLIVASHGHLYGFDDEPKNHVSDELKDRYATWDIANLPWNEMDFKWKYVKKDKSDETPNKIASAFSNCDEICIATDDDPTGEGELLAWEVIWQKQIKASKYTRMYFADEAPASIQKAFKERKLLGTDIKCMFDDPDYKQAIFRTKWDYLSMQWSRVATQINGQYGQVLRNGRLKSAMVVIVGDQLKLCSEYVKKPFYQNRFKDEKGVVYQRKDEPKFLKKDEVPACYHASQVVVDSKEMKETTPPKFLDLATLSAMLAAQGITAKTVLATYQSMYEAGIVSYPRTEDKCITMEQFNQLLPFVNQIADVVGIDKANLTHLEPRKTHIKDGMAHGANRPGLTVPESLDSLSTYGTGAKEIYEILARNYLATLCENYQYEQQKGHLQDYPEFIGSANIAKSQGWKAVYNDENETDSEEAEAELGLGTVAEPFIYEGSNPKPAKPTMKWLMKQLEKREVGTGATRTSTYADVTNAKTKYPLLVEKKGKLTFAECGEANYKLIKNTHIADLTMTEQVMEQMKNVAEGKSDGLEYLHAIQQMVVDDIATMTKNNGGVVIQQLHQKKEKAEGIWKKTNKQVSFSREWGGHRFTDEEVSMLLEAKEITFDRNGKSVTGMLANCEYNGNKYVGFQMVLKNFQIIPGEKKASGSNDTLYKCPKCGSVMRKYDWGLGCSNYKNGCKVSIGYKNPFGATLTDGDIKYLLKDGKTNKKVQCMSKAGKRYEAKMVINKKTGYKVVPDFMAK